MNELYNRNMSIKKITTDTYILYTFIQGRNKNKIYSHRQLIIPEIRKRMDRNLNDFSRLKTHYLIIGRNYKRKRIFLSKKSKQEEKISS